MTEENAKISTSSSDAQESLGASKKDEGKGLTIPAICREANEEASFVHPADMADHLENLSLEKQVCALRHMPKEDAAEALAELEENVAVDVLENLDADTAAQIIAEMDPDDAADVLDELDEDHRDVLLGHLEKEDSEELRNLLNFDPNSAAGVMNTELILVEETLTVDNAIACIRHEMEEKETPYYAYVVDDKDFLVGVLSLRNLMLSRPGTLLKDAVAGQNVVSVPYDMPKGEVAAILSHYNYMAIPVVDYEGHIMGLVTYDDTMDIMHEEASADMLGMVGADPEESVDTPWLESVAKRLPWLVINMINSALSAWVVYMFEGSIAQMAVLAVLMPMIANQAGNTGQQALAVMIRQLATDRFDSKKSWMAVIREGKIGIVTGVCMALLSFIGAWIFTKSMAIGLVMAGALFCDMLLGALAGGSIPLIFRALGRDPAQASSIFLTTLTDSAGFFIFLGLATAVLL
ncbi:MAG: magnesium transporter [Desulfovibrio sp.]|nr:magnesium transporter [Desulfovibrio sp.]